MLGAPQFRQLLDRTAVVCPFATPAATPETEPLTCSQWATKYLEFQPSDRQREALDSDARFLMLCCNRQWGKSTVISVKALHAALTTPKTNIILMARSKEQAGLVIEKAGEGAFLLGHKIRRVLGNRFSLQFSNGSTISAIAHNEFTVLGRTAAIVIVDEAAVVTDRVYFAIEAFVSRSKGKIWLLSTPTRQSGFFYNYWHEETKIWHKIFSNVEDCPEIDRDFLDLQMRSNPTRYRQDFLCEFIQPANRLCSREFVRSMLIDPKQSPKPGSRS